MIDWATHRMTYEHYQTCYILTHPNTRIEDELFMELFNQIPFLKANFNERLSKHGVHHRSGAALFSAFLPEDYCYNDKNITIIDGILVNGQITPKYLDDIRRTIIFKIKELYGEDRCVWYLLRLFYVLDTWAIEQEQEEKMKQYTSSKKKIPSVKTPTIDILNSQLNIPDSQLNIPDTQLDISLLE